MSTQPVQTIVPTKDVPVQSVPDVIPPKVNRRFVRKQDALKFNHFHVPTTLDPEAYAWKKNCRKCSGRGFLGTIPETKQIVPCSCLRRIVRPAETITDENKAAEVKKFQDAVGGPLPLPAPQDAPQVEQAPVAPAP